MSAASRSPTFACAGHSTNQLCVLEMSRRANGEVPLLHASRVSATASDPANLHGARWLAEQDALPEDSCPLNIDQCGRQHQAPPGDAGLQHLKDRSKGGSYPSNPDSGRTLAAADWRTTSWVARLQDAGGVSGWRADTQQPLHLRLCAKR